MNWALIRMWQKEGGSKWELGKNPRVFKEQFKGLNQNSDRALIGTLAVAGNKNA